MGVRIAPASASDRDAAVELWHAAELTRPWNDPCADFDLASQGTASDVLLARDGETLIGSVMVGFDGHRGWVYYLAVAPSRQSQGIGRALMQAAEEWLKARSCPKIQLMVRTDNESAKGFYAA
ncbi:MAG: GNAT family N-acetyltransferase, partial [Rhizobiales bacterium 63-7]